MLTVKKTIIIEIILFMLVCCAIGAICANGSMDDNLGEQFTKVSVNLLDLNNAIVVAFLISLITGKAFVLKGRQMKKIARHSTLLFLINSALASVLSIMFRTFGLAIVVPAFVGNMLKFYDISKNFLDVL